MPIWPRMYGVAVIARGQYHPREQAKVKTGSSGRQTLDSLRRSVTAPSHSLDDLTNRRSANCSKNQQPPDAQV